MKKNCLNLLLILVLALSLTACGGNDSYDNSNDPVNAWEVLADEDLTDDVTAWQGDDGSQLLLDISTSSYTFRTWYGRVEPEDAPPSRAAYAAVGIAVRIGFTGLTDSSALLTHFAIMTCPVGRTLARSSTDSMLSTNCG